MPSQKSGRGSTTQPVPTRRSRRQERIARQHPERDLARASTHGKSGNSNFLLLMTGLAVVIGLGLVAYGILNNNDLKPLSSVQPAAYKVTTDIPHNGRTLGSETAPVTLTIYADYQCPTCGMVGREYMQKLVENYVKTGKVKFVHRDYIVNTGGGSTESLDAANAARCAADQDRFWQMNDALFYNQQGEYKGAFAKDRLVAIGKMIGLDMAKFEPCVRNGTHNGEVTAESAATPKSVTGTPTFFINDVQVSGVPSVDLLASRIDDALAAKNATPAPSPSATATPTQAPTATPVPTPTPSAVAS